MEERIERLLNEVKVFLARDKKDLDAFRLKYISKKGEISELFEELKKVSSEQKKNVGKVLNQLKQAAESKLAELTEKLDSAPVATSEIDLTLPPVPNGSKPTLRRTRFSTFARK